MAPFATPPDLGGTSPPQIPDHELLRCIGSGSYGEVWLARNVMGTYRAVKVIYRATFSDDRPYEREYHGMQRFEPVSRSHDGLVDILQIGRNNTAGYFYYVMELGDDAAFGQKINPVLYEAKTLGKAIAERNRLPSEECVQVGSALASALSYLHQNGLIHRDIKPSNIIFVNGIPKIADIGLVAEVGSSHSFVGTEGFMPPEGPGTAQADIYSLGKVLYELSTGHDRHQFPELPTNVGDLTDGDQLGELNEILLRACQRNPTTRYQTAAEMHADLALLDSGRSVVRLRGIERRLRFVQRGGAIVTLIAAVIALGWWWQARQTGIVRKLAAQKSQLAEEKTRL